MAVKYQFLEEYLETLPINQREIVEELDRYVLNSSDKISFKFSYGLPFYEYIKNVCYINCKKNGVVNLGFWNGKFLKDIPGLEFEGRVMIKAFTYRILEDINEEVLVYSLHEALRLQDEMY
ncbi:MAG: hypothetical protein CVV25_06900 [Ignavibacteriae bacterium HGW-Ignavibacteriae-4]|nr:MAG: hypothetical protein CVV25_06900 [Ignavibacteriae bacterium HGW-Ignavibacteriae-4]